MNNNSTTLYYYYYYCHILPTPNPEVIFKYKPNEMPEIIFRRGTWSKQTVL